MLPSPQLDPDTQRFVNHLNAYLNDETDDTEPARTYYDFVSLHKYLLQAGDPLSNPILSTVMPLLSRIMNSERYDDDYVEFLRDLLMLVPMKTTWVYFPKDEMLKAIDYPSPVKLFTATVDLVAWRVSCNDEDAVEFVDTTALLPKAVLRCLSDHSIPDRFWTVESLVKSCDGKLLDEITTDLMHCVDLVALQSDSALTTRYMALAERVISRRLDLKQINYAKLIAVVDSLSFFDDTEETSPDALMYSVIIDFYTNLVGLMDGSEALFLSLQPVIVRCLNVLAVSVVEKAAFVSPRLTELFGKLTYCKDDGIVAWAKQQEPVVAILDNIDLKAPFHNEIFLKTNPAFISKKRQLFDTYFAAIDLASMDYILFACVLHAFEDPDFFNLFASEGKLSNSTFSRLPKDLLYKLLEIISRHNHSAKHLLSEMPTVVSSYLIELSGNISDRSIRNEARSTIENLLNNKDLDLGVWKDGLRNLLRTLIHGPLRGPQVDVSDEAL
ncbi:hypothetical protein FT663_02625 [Candidozyma haemuli var. vulneris]|uniref:DNA mismatch repair protein HSM3 C-terminal domain-containing protein n=1 Tax=Candidozyma haemuli TaxID=45357 RepID=A0A2V1AWH0_9ASCO|nr:hypothetical protein CXQ85_004865 [[Candida] haemuloni]KAF3991648.1 hypothetical protein FT663_02625 [[Candida] haemuloni var. vulneris]KAF3993677.1 hypothetical protein FT662_00390 [[Candida] haemuloni var. vulneris]PVH22195.1 hypothetical protein CXQ85_004865 [[Candida] haemuloni]